MSGDHESGHDEKRRAFLAGALAGAGVAAGAGLISEAAAQTHDHPGGPAAAPQPAAHEMANGDGVFFNQEDAQTIAAFTERLMPGAPGKPGAHEAGVLRYIDLALAGAYADKQDFYRAGLAALNAFSRKGFNADFRRLAPAQQDQIIAALEADKAPEFVWPTARDFFNTVRTHTMEGMFADPAYGGNKDFAGWRLIGFPGAQAFFTAEDMTSGRAFTREPMTGLQMQAAARKL